MVDPVVVCQLLLILCFVVIQVHHFLRVLHVEISQLSLREQVGHRLEHFLLSSAWGTRWRYVEDAETDGEKRDDDCGGERHYETRMNEIGIFIGGKQIIIGKTT